MTFIQVTVFFSAEVLHQGDYLVDVVLFHIPTDPGKRLLDLGMPVDANVSNDAPA